MSFIYDHPILGTFGSLLIFRPFFNLLGVYIPSKLIDRRIFEYGGSGHMFIFYLASILECVLLIVLLFLVFGPFDNLQHFPKIEAFADLSVIVTITCGPVAFYKLSRHQLLPFRELWL